MTMAISDYPRKQVGKVAEINGMTTDDGPWVAVHEALDITGLRSGVLVRWEEEGLISVIQDFARSPRRYLKPELEIIAGLSTYGPPNLRSLRHYLASHSGRGGEGGQPESPQEKDTAGPDGSEVEAFMSALTNLLRGQKLLPEMADEGRLRVTKDAASRPVTIECRRRASDNDRWWFTWGGGVWLCEADNPTEAVVQLKAALRTMGGSS